MEKIDLNSLKGEAEKRIEKAENVKELDDVFKDFLKKNQGRLSLVLSSIKDLTEDKKAAVGKEANEIKAILEEKIEKKKVDILAKAWEEEKGFFDITVPGKKPAIGHLHPLTQVKRRAMEIFQGMGFSVIEGPEIEIEWYNFDALNIPKDHPARDAWDTFWIKGPERFLLRTHTSPVQVRYMEKNSPPFRIIAPGKAFRHEATDASHEFQFYQIEGLMVDKDVNVSHFKSTIQRFLSEFFEKDVAIRLRPDFFPFTEPSFEIAVTCLVCNGKGCPVCKKTGWSEVAGAGMVHPNVFSACKLEAKEWQGWAFGFGLNRLTMMKYKINDIRLFNSGDLRFLNQF